MYRIVAPEVKLRGVLLSILRDEFGERLPTLEEYCTSQELAPSTIFRLKKPVLEHLLGFLSSRGPGAHSSQVSELSEVDKRVEVLQAVSGVIGHVNGLPSPVPTAPSSPRRLGSEAKEILLRARDRLKKTAKVTAEQFSKLAGIGSGQMRRWARQRKASGSLEAKSRRPHQSPTELAGELAEAIVRFRTAYPKLSITAFCKLFNENHPEELGRAAKPSVSRKAIARLLKAKGLYKPAPDHRPSPDRRGVYTYLGKLTGAMMDTVWLNVAGVKLAVVTLMDSGTRAILGCSVDLSESAAAIQELIAKTLERFPTISATIQDHGTPYRERTLREYLDEMGILRIFCKPHHPQTKGALERFFLTMQTCLEESLTELETVLSEQTEQQKRTLLPALVGFLLNALYLSGYHNQPQEHIDSKSPAERMAEPTPPRASEALSPEDLAANLQANRPKTEQLAEIAEHFGFTASAAKVSRELARFPIEALRQARHRLDEILLREGPASSKSSLSYLAGIAANVTKEQASQKQHRLAQERQRREEEQQRAAELQAQHARLDAEQEHPEQVAETFMRAHQVSLQTPGKFGLSTAIRKIREAVASLFQRRPAVAILDVDKLIEQAGSLPGPQTGRDQLIALLQELIDENTARTATT